MYVHKKYTTVISTTTSMSWQHMDYMDETPARADEIGKFLEMRTDSAYSRLQERIHKQHPNLKPFFANTKVDGTWYKGPKQQVGLDDVIGDPGEYCYKYARLIKQNESMDALQKRTLVNEYTESVRGMCYAYAEAQSASSQFQHEHRKTFMMLKDKLKAMLDADRL